MKDCMLIDKAVKAERRRCVRVTKGWRRWAKGPARQDMEWSQEIVRAVDNVLDCVEGDICAGVEPED